MVDWDDYYSGQRVGSLARFVALRHHDARVGGPIPGLVQHCYTFIIIIIRDDEISDDAMKCMTVNLDS